APQTPRRTCFLDGKGARLTQREGAGSYLAPEAGCFGLWKFTAATSLAKLRGAHHAANGSAPRVPMGCALDAAPRRRRPPSRSRKARKGDRHALSTPRGQRSEYAA